MHSAYVYVYCMCSYGTLGIECGYNDSADSFSHGSVSSGPFLTDPAQSRREKFKQQKQREQEVRTTTCCMIVATTSLRVLLHTLISFCGNRCTKSHMHVDSSLHVWVIHMLLVSVD